MTPSLQFDFLQDDLYRVEQRMCAQVEQDFPALAEALLPLIRRGGKRLRPTLTLLSGAMLGAPHQPLVSLAAGIEMLHTATLVHDDLIDGALLRRGNPTLNAHWSPAVTVLSGDTLFACAAGLVAQCNSLPAMRLFSSTLATIVNGEVSQLLSQSSCQSVPTRAEYYQRIAAKTAALFRTCTLAAGLLSPAGEEDIAAVGRYGYEIGMAFQIADDVLDFSGDEASVGKPLGSDLRQGILTLPLICYHELHADDPDLRAVLQGSHANGEVQRLTCAIQYSGATHQALEEGRAFVERGLAAIAPLPTCREHTALDDLARFIVARTA